MPPARNVTRADPRLALSEEQQRGMAGKTKTRVRKRPVRRVTREERSRGVVEQRSPRIAVPDLASQWTQKEQPKRQRGPRKPRSVVFKDPPERKRLPTQGIERMRPDWWGELVLTGGLSRQKWAGIDKANQEREERRRALARTNKAARKQRKARLTRLDPNEKDNLIKVLGKEGVREFLETGELPEEGPGFLGILAAAGAGIGKGLAGAVTDASGDFQTQLSAGARGRQHKGEMTAEDMQSLGVLEEMLIGEDLVKAITGGEFNPWIAGAEGALLFMPVKGLPTPVTSALRALYGGKAWAKALKAARAGDGTLGEAMAHLNVSVYARKSEKYARIAGQGKTSSSTPARLAADAMERAGVPAPIVKFIRNDPTARRTFTHEASRASVPAARARLPRLAEKIWDAQRPRLSALFEIKGKQIGFAKTEQEKWSQAIGREIKQAEKQAMDALVMLDAALGRGVANRLFRRLDIPDYYALRMVGKGVSPGEMINTHKSLAAEALRAGDMSTAARQEFHAAMATAAAHQVDEVGGALRLNDTASRKVKEVYERMLRAGERREEILVEAERLTEAEAAMRIANEEQFYYGARFQSTEQYFKNTLAASPNRQRMLEIAQERDPGRATASMEAMDGIARSLWERETAKLKGEVKRLEGLVAAGSTDPMDAVRLAGARATLVRGIDPDIFYRQIEDVLGGFPEGDLRMLQDEWGEDILAQLEEFHTFTPEQIRAHKVTRDNPANPGIKEVVKNKRFVRTVNGARLTIFGDVTPHQWVERVLAVMPDKAARDAWAKWYDEFEPMFRSVFEDDADKLMRGFAVSQANASPAGGLNSVFMVLRDLMRGVKVVQRQAPDKNGKLVWKSFAQYADGTEVQKGYSSIVAYNIARAIDNGEIDSGLGAKLSDFIDSLLGKETRTWMGNSPTHGRPVAVDVHAARDRGLVDPKLVKRLEERYGLKRGVDFEVDNLGGSPEGVIYERTAEWYEQLTDHLNAVKFDGRDNWQPRETQALGWAAIQMLHGADPQDFTIALARNTRELAFEITQGPSGLGEGVDPTTIARIARQMEPEMRALGARHGVWVQDIRVDQSTWQGSRNVSVHLEALGDEEGAELLATAIARAFDQEMVQISREITRRGAKASLVVASPAFDDAVLRMNVTDRLQEIVPALKGHGSMPDEIESIPAFAVITQRGYLNPEDEVAWLEKFRAGIEQVEQEFGIDIRFGSKNYDLKVRTQHGAVDSAAEGGSVGGVSLDDLDPDSAAIRRRLIDALEGRASATEGGLTPRIDALEAEIDAAIRERAAQLGGTREVMSTGGRVRRAAREWEPGIGRRGAIGGRPGRFIEDPTQRVSKPFVSARENALARAEQELIEEGGDVAAKMDELAALRAEREATEYPEWARFDAREADPEIQALAERRAALLKQWESASDVGAEDSARRLGREIGAVDAEIERLRAASPRLSQIDPFERSPLDWSDGQKLSVRIPGADAAVKALQKDKVPLSYFRRLVADQRLSKYQKVQIMRFLDDAVGGKLIARKRALGSLNWQVKGLDDLMWPEAIIRGMWKPSSRTMIIGSRGALPTMLHETAHAMQTMDMLPQGFLDDLGEVLGVVDGKWTAQQQEDLAAVFEAVMLGLEWKEIGVLKGVPRHVQDGLKTLKDAFRDEANKAMQKNGTQMLARLQGDELGERVLDQARALFVFEHYGNAHGFHGANPRFRNRGQLYMPETRALPMTWAKDLTTLRRWHQHLQGLGGKSALRATDEALSHQFRAVLLKTGAFDADVIKGSLRTQMRAAKIHSMWRLKQEALKISTEAPVYADDIAIPVGAQFSTLDNKQVGFLQALFRSLDDGEKITDSQINEIARETWEEAADAFFGGMSKASEKQVAELVADIKAGLTKSPEGVRWVRRKDLLDTGLFDLPTARGGIGTAADSVNDVLKAMTLVLKPSYIPMNFVGNTTMALMQQGFMAPINFARAVKLSRNLGDNTALIDWFGGSGHIRAVYQSRGHVPGVSKALDAATEFSGFAVDRMWRRAAFIYEAGKEGFFTDSQILDLVTDLRHADALSRVSQRTKNALVDFDNLSQWEKDVASRIIFVYPWFKGATYWAGRFVKDHPIQAATYASLVAWQQERIRETFPDGYPSYMKWYLPVTTVNRNGRELPYGLRLDQALTFLTPIDIGSDIYALATGRGLGGSAEEPFGSHLNPLYDAIVGWAAGVDTFTGQPIDRSLRGFLALLNPAETSVFWKQVERIMRSDEERSRHPGIYPTNRREDWLKLFWGSLSPTPIDPVIAAERYGGTDPTTEDNLRTWKAKAADAFGQEIPDEVVQLYSNLQAYNAARSDVERELGVRAGGLTLEESALAHVLAYVQVNGGTLSEEKKQRILDLDPEADEDVLEEIIDDVRKRLGLTKARKLTTAVGDILRERRKSNE